ncbi:hypothetical protein WJX73_007453 [Symbiochloris irregularis]|uniref:Uncharacterized protein n=1 Tax=Symbiochloris irregularis TaxID=706552 RepID=A0AAW1NN40_9CHLO
MLLGLEVAMEYMLALLHSPQVQLLRHHDALRPLQEEVRQDLQQVWGFIVEREVEAPSRFQAIQSYRATMAVLRQQQQFIKQLFDSGVVEETERDELARPLQEKERRLTQKGPVWKAPTFIEVLRSIPFLKHTPKRVVETLYRHGRLKVYKSGVYGLYTALTGGQLPGEVHAVAQGNALGRGPLVFELRQSGIRLIRKQAAAGIAAYEQIEVDMFRMAALYILERLKPQLMAHLLLCLTPAVKQRQNSTGPGSTEPGRMGTTAPAGNFRPSINLQRTSTLNRMSVADIPGYDDSEADSPRLHNAPSQSMASLPELPSQQALEEAVQDRALEFYLALQSDMTQAQLLDVPAGAPYLHMSSAVLLRGSLRVVGHTFDASEANGALKGRQTITYHAPFILPWVAFDGDADVAPIRFTALENKDGASGSFADEADVLLMVKQHTKSHLTQEALHAHAKTLEADEGDAVASLPRTPSGHRVSDAAPQQIRRVSRGMRALTRASRSIARPLSIQHVDMPEIIPPALRRRTGTADGGDWWNYLHRNSIRPSRTQDLPEGV